MKSFMNMKIATKLISGFILVALIGAFIGLEGYNSLGKINDAKNEIARNRLPSVQSTLIMSEAQTAVDSAENALLTEELVGADREAQYKRIVDAFKHADDAKKIYEQLPQTTEEKQVWDKFVPAWEKWKKDDSDYVNLSKQYDQNKDKSLRPKLVQQGLITNGVSFSAAEELLNQVVELNKKYASTASNTADNVFSTSSKTLIVTVFIGLLIALSISILISSIISKPIKKLLDVADKISEGNLNVDLDINTKDEVGDLAQSFKKVIIAIKLLTSDANMLVDAAVAGKLDIRADASKHSGDYKKIVEGVNNTLDSVIGPLNVAADYVDKISKGNIPAKITDTYNGDFNTIKNNLNVCIDSINLLVSDSGNLVNAALEGKLSTRADASKHYGDYKKIVEGVNNTLDAVIEPVKEAAAVLNEMSNGNLKVSMKGNYKGDHADIKNALNDTIESLSSYVTEISEVLREMSNSNLQLSINNEYKGDFARIKDALNLIIQSYNEVFTEINNAADQVSAGSNQVSDGSQALSQGTTEQASSIQELTASITEVAAQTKQNAVNASQANELALNAKEGAALGNSHMKEMLKSMEEINESSSSISKIIKVIDDIAFQTNMLALNAAVEAARAGQHGKGFAVVAEEVRNLAARSAKAAKETTDLVEGSMKKVEIGTKIANNTAESLDQIVIGVSKAATLVGEIAAASNEQATAIYQINKGIEQVSDVVQTNSATAEQSAAASEELSSQASMLKNMVGKFRLKGGSTASFKELSLETQRNSNKVINKLTAHAEAAATKSKPRISLSNSDFGKY